MKLKDLKRRSRSKKIILTIAMILVMAMGVGYSYLRDTLAIDNNTKMSVTWNVYFDNVQKLGNSMNPATTPSLNKTSFSTTLNFTDVSQVYETKFDVKNEGSLDASVNNFTTNPLPAELQSYFDVGFTYYDGTSISNGNLLSSGKTDSFRIRISLKNGVDVSELPESIPITVNVNYAKASQSDAERNAPVIKVLSGIKGNLQPGDQIKIGDTEEFYVVSSNAEKTVLLAKYNLLVGNIVENDSVTGTIPTTTSGYGLQSSEATGYVWHEGANEYKGTTAFYSSVYWDNKVGEGLDYQGSYSGNPYPFVYDSNSIIYPYISGENGYVDKLKEMGAPTSITGRLLTYEEADSLKEVNDNETSIIFDKKQSYWLGSASTNNGGIFFVECGDAEIVPTMGSDDVYQGVRPVIEISTSDI